MTETCWTVQERTWKDELPELPDEVSALLAPPVVVCASGLPRGVRRRTAGRAVPRAEARVG
ncbi:hypothetical protein [Dactylosporangium sp. NPDC048998]|uniref:hypothetical protein n=1 Tax=Dactylosporangium sp. NPDC048998 TaxID=3363976 RepID=UPI003717804A